MGYRLRIETQDCVVSITAFAYLELKMIALLTVNSILEGCKQKRKHDIEQRIVMRFPIDIHEMCFH